MFAHAMGHNVFRGTAGAAEGVRMREMGERRVKGEKGLKESGGHMSPLVLRAWILQGRLSC